jgi:two-component system LytT family response regulator
MYADGASNLAVENKTHMYTKAIFVRRRDAFERVDLSAIHYVEKLQNDCMIVTAEKTVSVVGSLTALEQRLDGLGFCRVHQSYLISLDHVEKVAFGCVIVKGRKIPIGDKYAPLFYGAIMRQPDVLMKARRPAPPVKRRKKRELE